MRRREISRGTAFPGVGFLRDRAWPYQAAEDAEAAAAAIRADRHDAAAALEAAGQARADTGDARAQATRDHADAQITPIRQQADPGGGTVFRRRRHCPAPGRWPSHCA
jgi:hypothetical protein